MKKQINQLIELAKEVREFGKEVGLPQNHNELSGDVYGEYLKSGAIIKVYFSNNYDTCCVYFGTDNMNRMIEITFFNNSITLPQSEDATTLTALYKFCKETFKEMTDGKMQKIKEDAENRKAHKIKELEKELEYLKNNDNESV